MTMATVYGHAWAETINILDGVTNGADTIWGYGGNDDIFGWGGADIIIGGDGADDINGGAGSDWSDYRDSTSGVTVSLITGAGFGGYAEGDQLTSIENLSGSWYDDFLIGNDSANILSGLGGDDILKGGGGADTLNGGSGDDTLKGGGGADELNGGAGNDTANYFDSGAGVFVYLGGDVASGGDAEGDNLNSIENVTGSAYHDDIWGSDGANVLRGNGGADTLKGFGGNDQLFGGDGNDTLYGMDGNDTLRGEDGNDTLNGGVGDDTMIGGIGDDTYYVDSAFDVVTEAAGQGTDVVYSSAYTYTLGANAEYLSLDTPGGAAVYGTGNSGDNFIFGNSNSNTLDGGGGVDQINGLGGNDTFMFHAGQANGDTVFDFEGNGLGAGDVIYFVGYGTVADGATFHQLNATDWEITSADGTIHDIIHLANGAAVDGSDFSFY
jgi:Ca2+-binding RTX toxin-like protein